MINRIVIIGDVHGCIDELEKLEKAAKIDPIKDVIYFVGDLINKGPSSKKVYMKYKEWGARSVLGNHEFSLLKKIKHPNLPKWVLRLKQDFGVLFSDFIADLKTWPLFIETPEFTLLHGGLIPFQNLEEMDPEQMLRLRYCQDPINGESKPWFEYYKAEKLVVFGHWAALQGIAKSNLIGLDTGCVYGNKLSCLSSPIFLAFYLILTESDIPNRVIWFSI